MSRLLHLLAHYVTGHTSNKPLTLPSQVHLHCLCSRSPVYTVTHRNQLERSASSVGAHDCLIKIVRSLSAGRSTVQTRSYSRLSLLWVLVARHSVVHFSTKPTLTLLQQLQQTLTALFPAHLHVVCSPLLIQTEMFLSSVINEGSGRSLLCALLFVYAHTETLATFSTHLHAAIASLLRHLL